METKLCKHVKRQPFVMIPNNLAQRECNALSLEAKGFLVDLLSRHPDWKIVGTYFMNLYEIGADKFYRITGELKEKKYLYIENIRDPNTGQFVERVWHVFDEPTEVDNSMVITAVGEIHSEGSPNLINTNINTNYMEIKTDELSEVSDSLNTDKKIPHRESTKDFPIDSDPYILGSHIIDCVDEHKNTYARYLTSIEGREALIQNQAYNVDLMIRIDKRTPEEILRVFDWVQTDTFWKPNVLSATSLRKYWDRLCKAMQEAGYVSPVDDPNPQLTSQIIEAYRALSNNFNFDPKPAQLQKFIEASNRAIKFFEGRALDPKNWVRYLTACLEKAYTNKSGIVYPGTMCSDTTWDILMPQYLHEVGLV